MNRFEKRKRAIEQSIREHIDSYKAVYKKAEDEDRDPTTDERLDIERELKSIETLREELSGVEDNIKTLQEVEDIGKSLGPVSSLEVKTEPADRAMYAIQQATAGTDLGKMFVDSDGYKSAVNAYREGGRLPSNFSTGLISLEAKGTLMETPGSGGAAFVNAPQAVPGVVDRLFQRLTVADLFLQGVASTSSLRYVVEGTATSGAAGVLEGGTKPESTLGLTTADEAIKKIATLLPVSEEMLEDGPAIQSYINGRLVLFVQIEEERQLLRGTAGGAEVQGLLTSRSVPVYSGGTAAGNKAEQLFKAMNSMRGSALIEPEWVIMSPGDYETIRLLKDANGQLYGGGPFMGPYGNNGQASPGGGMAGGASETIWTKPIVVTGALGTGTAVIGTRTSAQVWRRGGISVEASNSHGVYFALNLVAIRAEERLGLAVYRPTGFVEARLA